jgi:general L-amino acid transport system permease protein
MESTRRSVVWQSLALLSAAIAVGWIASTTVENLRERGIASGFGFLLTEAGFEIGETTWLEYEPRDSYLHAIGVGVLNTLRVAALAIVVATVLGGALGLARLSRNWLLAKLADVYVETIRNVPLLVQLFFWYAVITEHLPAPAEALNPAPGFFLTNRGVAFPSLRWPFDVDYPELTGFNFSGGASLSPEFAALVIGLIVYSGSFIAEVVRGGILSVDRGQFEAAHSLGLGSWATLRFVILPQALRAIVPPLTSQYLNITKNSSLAVAIGYPDLVSIANTIINQTGQAIEGIAIIMFVYLSISLTLSVIMNWYNRAVGRRGGHP